MITVVHPNANPRPNPNTDPSPYPYPNPSPSPSPNPNPKQVAQLSQELAALRRPVSARVPHPPSPRATSARPSRPAAALPRSFLDAGPGGASPYLAGAPTPKRKDDGEMPWLKDKFGRRLP